MKKWISVHLFSSLPFEEIIRNAVSPILRESKFRMLIRRFFFIRYWEGGQHVRIRIQPVKEKYTDTIRDLLKSRFGAFLVKFPSERINTPSDKIIYPNDSVQFIPYEPEIERYGGPYAIDLAEEHFELSSIVTLDLVCSSQNFDYEKRLANVINLNIAFAKCVFNSNEEKYNFYKSLYWQWLPHTVRALGINDVDSMSEEHVKELYYQLFTRNKEKFIQYQNMIETSIDMNEKFDQTWMNSWIKGTAKIHEALSILNSENLISSPNSTDFSSIDRIYYSYFHMLNNRLGIHNKDESLLAYVLLQIFSQ